VELNQQSNVRSDVKTQVPGHLGSLTGLRFILAFWVLVYHQSIGDGMLVGFIPRHGFLSNALRVGYFPVSVFFVLSGFVMAYNYGQRLWTRRAWRIYLWSRLIRIYPTYLLGLVLMAPVIVTNIFQGKASWSYGFWFQGAASALLIQSWIPPIAICWNVPGWSLSNEMFFYVCFPLISPMILANRRFLGVLAVSAFWLATVAILLLAIVQPIAGFGNVSSVGNATVSNSTFFFKYNPVLHLNEFLVGIIAARWFSRLKKQQSILMQRGYLLYAPAIALFAIIVFFADRLPLPLMGDALLSPLYATVIVGLALGGGWLSEILSTKPLILLGHASYALYILHIPIAHQFTYFYRRQSGHEFVGLPHFVVYALIATCCSLIVFLCFEQSLNTSLKRFLITHPKYESAVAGLPNEVAA
jgi:peptidoglycan/LPS O-acetylase OafA/YrhL